MTAKQEDLYIEQGATWSKGWLVTLNGTPIGDTWTAKCQVSEDRQGSGAPLHVFSPTVTPEGAVVLDAPASDSSTWTDGVYDVVVTNADESIALRVVEGRITVSPEVSK